MESTLSLYYIFYMVGCYGSISKAAKELFISQPAVSKSISKLEKELDILLFYRNSRGVTLTEEGKILFDSIKKAFSSIKQGEESINQIRNLGIGQIRIGVSSTLCKFMLLPYLKQFIEAYPHIKVIIDCQSTFHTIKSLEMGTIDIGLIGKPVSIKHIDFFPIQTIQDTFVTTKTYLDNLMLREYKLQNEKTLSLSEHSSQILSVAHLMLLDEENITRKYINQYFELNQIKTNHVLEVSNMDLLIEFAKIGLGISCVIKEFVQLELEQETLIELPLKSIIPCREVGFSYIKHKYQNSAIKKFIDFCMVDFLPNAT